MPASSLDTATVWTPVPDDFFGRRLLSCVVSDFIANLIFL
jgi:hypothetical protein